MVTYKKGDLWKALILIALIVAAFWFVFRTVMKANPRAQATALQQAAGQPGAQNGANTVNASTEMFAPRDRGVTQLLARARVAPDPFRPYASLLPPPPVKPTPTASPAQQKAQAERPQPSEAETQLRLVGLLFGARPSAVLVGADGHHYVRVGDDLPGGWRLAQIDQRSVTLTKGGQRARLQLRKGGEA